VAEGKLVASTKLPPIRSLASEYSVSIATAAAAYRELRLRGVVTTSPKGTHVAGRAPLVQVASLQLAPDVHNLADGNPDPELLPDLRAAILDATEGVPKLLYGDKRNVPRLLELAGERFKQEGVDVGDLAIVSGAFDGIERVLEAHLRSGDLVAVEDPGFPGVFDLVRGLGMGLLPVEIDELGPKPDSLTNAFRAGAQACVITPRAQNPTGAAIDESRSHELADIQQRHPQVLWVEDYHSEFIGGTPVHTVRNPVPTHWAIVRSVGKSLGPDLRLAILAADKLTISRVEGRQSLGAGWVSQILQRAVLHLWTRDAVRDQLRNAGQVYDKRRMYLRRALAERGIESIGESGWNVWISVPEESEIVLALHQLGWGVASGDRFRLHSPPGIRITTSRLKNPEQASAFADSLEKVLAAGATTRTA